MVKVSHIANDGTETATVELDDFTVKVIYSGIADMLREAADLRKAERAAPCDFESHGPRDKARPSARSSILTA